jgi:hypothetical protein
MLFEALSRVPAEGEASPLALLVKRLQDSLSRLDTFEVESTNGATETGETCLPRLINTPKLTTSNHFPLRLEAYFA